MFSYVIRTRNFIFIDGLTCIRYSIICMTLLLYIFIITYEYSISCANVLVGVCQEFRHTVLYNTYVLHCRVYTADGKKITLLVFYIFTNTGTITKAERDSDSRIFRSVFCQANPTISLVFLF